MRANRPSTRLAIGLVAAALLLAMPSAAAAQAPKLVNPKAGATVAVGARPVFKVRDGVAATTKKKVFITISTTRKRQRNGDLRRTRIGTFAATQREGRVFSYRPPDYDFPTWFLSRPGTYFWQTFRIDCSVPSCHVHSKTRRFRVQG